MYSAQVYDLFASGSGFQNPLAAASTTTTTNISESQGYGSALSGVTVPAVKNAMTAGGMSDAKISGLNSIVTSAYAGTTGLVNYGQQSVDEVLSRAQTTASHNNAMTAIGRAPTNCNIVSDSFRIVQETGKQWLSTLGAYFEDLNSVLKSLVLEVQKGASAVVATVTALAQQATAAVNSAITQVTAVLSQITAGIAAELAYINKLAKECLTASMAYFCGDWFKDGCLGSVMNDIGTPELKAAVKNVS